MKFSRYIVAASLLSCAASFGEETPAASSTDPMSYVTNHLELGTRFTYFILKNDSKETFLGSIDHLGDQQVDWPVKLYADYLFCPYGGLELTWDRMAAVATTQPPDTHTDGKFVLEGPILTAIVRYPNESAFMPYAGLGAAFYSASFEAESWWANGWNTEQDFLDAGKPPGQHNDRGRVIDPKDAVGFVATAGSDIKITKNISADLYFRYMQISTDAHFYLTQGGAVLSDKGTTSIPFDNYTLGAGIKYVF